jgi:hypothetical protein
VEEAEEALAVLLLDQVEAAPVGAGELAGLRQDEVEELGGIAERARTSSCRASSSSDSSVGAGSVS